MKNSLKNFYEDYWEHRKSIGKIHTRKDFYIPHRLKVAISMLPDVEYKISILDAGCGEGALGMLIKERFNNVFTLGFDISEKSLELAKPFYDKVLQMDIEQDDLKDKLEGYKFDYIICTEMLEHLFYPKAALEKFRSVLSNNGYLISSFPNIAWWQYRLKLLKGHFPEESRSYHHAEHLHDFTMHTFKELLHDSGYKVDKIDGQFIPPRFIKHLRPKSLKEKFVRRYPNLFGYQIVIKSSLV